MCFTPSKTGSTNEVSIKINDESIAWAHFGLPNGILDALRDLKYQTPTEIQSLTLPPAILGMFSLINKQVVTRFC